MREKGAQRLRLGGQAGEVTHQAVQHTCPYSNRGIRAQSRYENLKNVNIQQLIRIPKYCSLRDVFPGCFQLRQRKTEEKSSKRVFVVYDITLDLLCFFTEETSSTVLLDYTNCPNPSPNFH
jgi:hypothetical protein